MPNNETRARDQKHDTEVRENYSPAINKERIRQTEREEQTIATDREIHQDHYQTRIQPIDDKVVEEETHSHNVLPVERRFLKHGKDHEIRQKLAAERENFKDSREILPKERQEVLAAKIVGEHIHHHVHEQVQPVIEREIVQPSIVHTTVPIHERIEHEPTFHPATVQPRMTMDEFKKAGGAMEGRPEVRDVFEGEPQVRENGGAHQTHPNAHGGNGHHTDHPSKDTRDSQIQEQAA